LTLIVNFAENTEEADSEETLESDKDGYPLLTGNMLELRLSHQKGGVEIIHNSREQQGICVMNMDISTEYASITNGPTWTNGHVAGHDQNCT
jgi:hypothetical protein